MDSDTGSTIGAIVGLVVGLVVFLGVFLFFSYCLKRIVEKITGQDPGMLIWIPIAQLVPLLNAVGWETWKIVLFFIPIVSIVFAVLLWIEVLKKLNKNPALVICMFVPCVNLFFIPWLAFGN